MMKMTENCEKLMKKDTLETLINSEYDGSLL